MGNLGFQEILLIAVVVLVLFGGRKIPEFMRGLGKGIREFNDAKKQCEERTGRRYERKRPDHYYTTVIHTQKSILAFVSLQHNQRLS